MAKNIDKRAEIKKLLIKTEDAFKEWTRKTSTSVLIELFPSRVDNKCPRCGETVDISKGKYQCGVCKTKINPSTITPFMWLSSYPTTQDKNEDLDNPRYVAQVKGFYMIFDQALAPVARKKGNEAYDFIRRLLQLIESLE